jgi:hypothetical protein
MTTLDRSIEWSVGDRDQVSEEGANAVVILGERYANHRIFWLRAYGVTE